MDIFDVLCDVRTDFVYEIYKELGPQRLDYYNSQISTVKHTLYVLQTYPSKTRQG
jgi:hypothetical protein